MQARQPDVLDDLKDTVILSREEKMPGIIAPGIPAILPTDKKPEQVKNVTPDLPKLEKQLCVNCQQPINVLMKFCPNCGEKLMSVCKKCGAENQSGKFCSECGKALHGKKRPTANPT